VIIQRILDPSIFLVLLTQIRAKKPNRLYSHTGHGVSNTGHKNLGKKKLGTQNSHTV
jgi:hypothetical protein